MKMKLHEETLDQAVQRESETKLVDNKNEITDALDDALRVADAIDGRPGSEWLNILLEGRAGVGKTSIVRQWCDSNGLNMYAIDCKTLDTVDLGGVPYPVSSKGEGTPDRAKKLQSDILDQLDKPDSVLFLDELNRARADVRGTLLTLICDHKIVTPDAEGGERFFPNFLFTVAAINPPNAAYSTVDELDAAEKSRFAKVNVVANPKKVKEYLNRKLQEEIDSLKAAGVSEITKTRNGRTIVINSISMLEGRKNLVNTILSSAQFQFASDEDEARAAEVDDQILNPRSFEMAINQCDGTKKGLLSVWVRQCGEATYPMIEHILANYKDIENKANSVFQKPKAVADAEAKQQAADKQQNKSDIKVPNFGKGELWDKFQQAARSL